MTIVPSSLRKACQQTKSPNDTSIDWLHFNSHFRLTIEVSIQTLSFFQSPAHPDTPTAPFHQNW
jgi:hypothetical protein